MTDYLAIDDDVSESPVGPGKVTGFSDVGYPQVNGITVARLTRADGSVFDPWGTYKRDAIRAAARSQGDAA